MRFRGFKPAEPTGMQLAPMIDIVFLLLIFFIVTWSYARFETELDISVPAAAEGENPDRLIGEIVVNVHPDGRIVIEGRTRSEEQLLATLTDIAEAYKDQAVILRADKTTPFVHIIDVLDVCQKAGIWNVAFATSRPQPPAQPPAP